ncbi:type VI secretion system amidase effector protein Tae4 [Vibrio rhizosphaerae]|uniref:Type VI secretion system amidase effector protein Tae4 n=1 Tax=Vibrio rhizosphaerae TaxID=398736 RepID=A0ABU4IZN2_9VIBR|nr:type VI secretion system amidase effector protein Tae4 [Vibrio rhizosphaerae]MDW6094867.1 type VI secretion system amidase effector protein Tae4 [Vibrio rhizosphaerae]
MGSLTASAGNSVTTVDIKRPRFSDLWSAYSEVGFMSAPKVYELVGGRVLELYLSDSESYANACALRMSRGFNYGGFLVPSGTIIETYPIYRVRGADNKIYILRVKDLVKYIEFNWGKPEYDMNPSDISSISGKKGLIITEVSGWNDAYGHATLWDGSSTGDGSRYHELDYYQEHYNGAVIPTRVMLWELKD